MAEDSWQLNAEDITICKTDQGEDIMIGQGGFGSVCSFLMPSPM